MRVLVAPIFSPIRGGIEARTSRLHLAGHGKDSDSAAASLAVSVRAWCVGMAAAGDLEAALRRNRVRWEPVGDELVVEVE